MGSRQLVLSIISAINGSMILIFNNDKGFSRMYLLNNIMTSIITSSEYPHEFPVSSWVANGS